MESARQEERLSIASNRQRNDRNYPRIQRRSHLHHTMLLLTLRVPLVPTLRRRCLQTFNYLQVHTTHPTLMDIQMDSLFPLRVIPLYLSTMARYLQRLQAIFRRRRTILVHFLLRRYRHLVQWDRL